MTPNRGGEWAIPIEPIDDSIWVYGDTWSRNVSNMKAYTKFEVKADMVAIYKEAYDNIMEAIGNDLDADKTYDWTTNDPPILIFENEHKTYTKLL